MLDIEEKTLITQLNFFENMTHFFYKNLKKITDVTCISILNAVVLITYALLFTVCNSLIHRYILNNVFHKLYWKIINLNTFSFINAQKIASHKS